jgi:hypothetical protein
MYTFYLLNNLFYIFLEIWDRQDPSLHEDRRLPLRSVRLFDERDPSKRIRRLRIGKIGSTQYFKIIFF